MQPAVTVADLSLIDSWVLFFFGAVSPTPHVSVWVLLTFLPYLPFS